MIALFFRGLAQRLMLQHRSNTFLRIEHSRQSVRDNGPSRRVVQHTTTFMTLPFHFTTQQATPTKRVQVSYFPVNVDKSSSLRSMWKSFCVSGIGCTPNSTASIL